jgi:hypothetical protein
MSDRVHTHKVENCDTKSIMFVGSEAACILKCKESNTIAEYNRFSVKVHTGVESFSPALTPRERKKLIRIELPKNLKIQLPKKQEIVTGDRKIINLESPLQTEAVPIDYDKYFAEEYLREFGLHIPYSNESKKSSKIRVQEYLQLIKT